MPTLYHFFGCFIFWRTFKYKSSIMQALIKNTELFCDIQIYTEFLAVIDYLKNN